MKVLTCSRHFPAKHPKAGQPTYFVEKIWNSFNVEAMGETFWWPGEEYTEEYEFNKQLPYGTVSTFLSSLTKRNDLGSKGHTIRAGNRWQVGDMISMRVWSDKPYHSKQVEFAQVEVKKVWPVTIIIDDIFNPICSGDKVLPAGLVAHNDGLSSDDFTAWFSIHSKAKGNIFTGQIISWSDSINYTKKEGTNDR